MPSKIGLPFRPIANPYQRRQLIAYANYPTYEQNNTTVCYTHNFVDNIPIGAGASAKTVVYDSYILDASPEFPSIQPANIESKAGTVLTNGGCVGDYSLALNDWFSTTPTVTSVAGITLYQSFSPTVACGDVLSFAVWSDQPGTIEFVDANAGAPLPINDEQSLAFPAGTSSSYFYTVSNYELMTSNFFVKITNTGTGAMGVDYFTFYLFSAPSFKGGV